ncbi:MAG: sugar ABC transporter permease [Planctomycetota bacterium]|nr:sugar ABC transporter permease [Planctomycetota bacterium]MDA1027404.1 sugar ABC transporter permease [Planctomycetota bacterium]
MKHDSLRTGLLWIGPWLLGFGIFTVLPVSLAIYYGFTDYTLLESPIPVGTQNYERMLHDEILGTVLWNTAIFGVLSIFFGSILSIALAALLSKPARFQSFWRAAVFAPSVLPLVAIAVIFKLGYDPDPEVGLANQMIDWFTFGAFQGPNWFGSGFWAMTALLLMSLWSVGPAVVIYLAGLRDVPKQLHEAASIDGVGPVGRFFHVVLPMISPVILFNVIIGVINAAQVFAVPLIMTGGGPERSTYFHSMYVYDQAFKFGDMGYASALGVLQFAIILTLTGLILLAGRKLVYYRGA